jgi:membrane associated rhomboid family serine protease
MDRNSLIRRPFRYTFGNAALWLIAINVLVFALEYLIPGSRYEPGFVDYLVLRPFSNYEGAFPLSIDQGALWQPLTYMFVHDGLSHLLVNMLGLLFFGTAVEKELGTKEFLLYYLLTGFLGGAFSLAVYILSGTATVLVGASGAIFAVLLAFATLQPTAQILIWGIIPVRAPILVLGYAAIELAAEIFGRADGVAHLTHLAGLGFGWLYFLARFGVNPAKRFFPGR